MKYNPNQKKRADGLTVYFVYTHYDVEAVRVAVPARQTERAIAAALAYVAANPPMTRSYYAEIPCNGEAGGFSYRVPAKPLPQVKAVRALDQQSPAIIG